MPTGLGPDDAKYPIVSVIYKNIFVTPEASPSGMALFFRRRTSLQLCLSVCCNKGRCNPSWLVCVRRTSRYYAHSLGDLCAPHKSRRPAIKRDSTNLRVYRVGLRRTPLLPQETPPPLSFPPPPGAPRMGVMCRIPHVVGYHNACREFM